MANGMPAASIVVFVAQIVIQDSHPLTTEQYRNTSQKVSRIVEPAFRPRSVRVSQA